MKIYDSVIRLSDIVDVWKQSNEVIVMCNGCYDPLHAGHIYQFQEAKKLGTKLIITVTSDEFVKKQKGDHKPFMNINQRMELISEISCVDAIIANEHDTCESLIESIQPNIYIKGQDYQNKTTSNLDQESRKVIEYGGQIEFISIIQGINSSTISQPLSKQFSEYANTLPSSLGNDILETLEKVKGLRVLVIGEMIIDKYTYVASLHKAPKTSILAHEVISEETMAGGAVFVANIAANFVKNVTLITDFGLESVLFIAERTANNVKISNLNTGKPTIVKHRYLEKDFIELKHRDTLFEACTFDDSPLSDMDQTALIEMIKTESLDHDLVIVADFGHGLISSNTAGMISYHAPFLAVNTQSNESNWGYNVCDKYPYADYICIDDQELRLNARNKDQDLGSLIKNQVSGGGMLALTAGARGAMIGDKDNIITVPSIPAEVTDRIGAGDAFLAISSLFASQTKDKDIIGLVGNIAGALKVQTVCTSLPIRKEDFISKLKEILKWQG